MMDKNRTTRIALRCTPDELQNITALAATYGLPVADFIRQAIIIAAAKAQIPRTWQNAYYKALDAPDGIYPWNHS